MNCTGISMSADFNCLYPLQPGVNKTLIVGNLADIDTITEANGVVTDITMKAGTFLYEFEGVKQSVIPQYATAEPYGYTHEVVYSCFDISPEQKNNLEAMAYTPVFAIVQGMQGLGQGDNFFEIYGLKRGLYLEALTRSPADVDSAGAFVATLKTLDN